MLKSAWSNDALYHSLFAVTLQTCEIGVSLSQSNQKVYLICGILQIYVIVYELDVGKHYAI